MSVYVINNKVSATAVQITGCALSGPNGSSHVSCAYMTCGDPGYVCTTQSDSWEFRRGAKPAVKPDIRCLLCVLVSHCVVLAQCETKRTGQGAKTFLVSSLPLDSRVQSVGFSSRLLMDPPRHPTLMFADDALHYVCCVILSFFFYAQTSILETICLI